ncbi:MAG: DsbA family protein [Gemmatimonadaceae bacterium]|nr:DsbA family protein [Gemmatimonadaceae bacterium]
MAKPNVRASQKQFTYLIALIAIVGAGALGWAATRPKGGAVAVDPNLPVGTAEGFVLGKPDAPVQIVEFADFECPACAQFAMLTEPDIRARLINTGLVSVKFYVFPLPMHKNTWAASNAAFCANEQGKFWEMHDRLFYTQDLWGTLSTTNPDKKMKGYAKDLGLDEGKFDECYDSQRHYPNIKASGIEAQNRGIDETPSFIIGGKKYAGSLPYDAIKRIVDEELAKSGQANATKTPGAK